MNRRSFFLASAAAVVLRKLPQSFKLGTAELSLGYPGFRSPTKYRELDRIWGDYKVASVPYARGFDISKELLEDDIYGVLKP